MTLNGGNIFQSYRGACHRIEPHNLFGYLLFALEWNGYLQFLRAALAVYRTAYGAETLQQERGLKRFLVYAVGRKSRRVNRNGYLLVLRTHNTDFTHFGYRTQATA